MIRSFQPEHVRTTKLQLLGLRNGRQPLSNRDELAMPELLPRSSSEGDADEKLTSRVFLCLYPLLVQ